MRAFDAVLSEADLLLEDKEMRVISSEFAKSALSELVQLD